MQKHNRLRSFSEKMDLTIEEKKLNAFKPIWEGIRPSSIMSVLYYFFFCYRRLLYVAVLIFMADLPSVQCLLKLIMTLISLVYVVHTNPHDDRL